jgi:diguanylate cyclase (GGDEF)-like protein
LPLSTPATAGHGSETLDAAAVRRRLVRSFTALFVGVMLVAGLPGMLSDVDSTRALVWVATLAASVSLGMALAVRHVLGPIDRLVETGERLRGLYQDARNDSLVDPLTGLGNHRAFQEELARQLEGARELRYPLSVALIDLDDLKRTNDELGHAAGDRLLAAMGRLIATMMRSGDQGFRVGGDEFVVLMPRAEADGAYASVRRLLALALGDEETNHGRPSFSFSAGISTFPDLSPDATRLRRQADTALMWAKRHGRTDVQVFDPERHGAADDDRATPELAAAVADVAQRRALVPRFQPIYDLATGEPVGFEGLVRPDDSALFPDAVSLFVAAEATERTVELDLAAIEVVAAGVGDAVADRYLSLNLSPRTLEAGAFHASDVVAILDRSGIDPSRVVIELTEREAIEDLVRLQENLDACRAAGMRIAADDVGAGNAGLRLLSHVQFDIVKIDLSLVQGGVLRDAALGVLRAIRELAGRTGAVLVAEGIETAEQLSVVRRLGIAAGQGYLLAHPADQPQPDVADLDALERVTSVPEWVDPRLVEIGLVADPAAQRPADDEPMPSVAVPTPAVAVPPPPAAARRKRPRARSGRPSNGADARRISS